MITNKVGWSKLKTQEGKHDTKSLVMHKAATTLQDTVFNWVRPLKTVRQEVTDNPSRRWQPRTPGTASSLTDLIWTANELLTVLPFPADVNT